MTTDEFDLRPGEYVRAIRPLDPDGAAVVPGQIGVVFGRRNHYGDDGGPMVAWYPRDGDRLGGMCNVYLGDVEVVNVSEFRRRGGERQMEQQTERRMPQIGEAVVYVDPVGIARPALVTQPWGPTCANLVFVTTDAARTDPYGRQIERQSSCSHASVVPVHGNYWRFVDEPAKETERAA